MIIAEMGQKSIEMGMVNSMQFKKPIYVLLYHPWMDGFKEYFRVHLSWLKRNRFESIELGELVDYVRGEEISVPERPIAITLDDGTIENFTLVYPLLQEYGYTGTVFAPTANKYIEMSGMDWWREVEDKDVLRIEGHSHTHALAFVNDHVHDFYVREKKDREPIIKGLDARPGAPIFELGYELVLKRFLPDTALIDGCIHHVEKQGGVAFFEEEDWKEEMMNLISEYQGHRGRYETDEEERERIREELELPKPIIERAVGKEKKVHFFAYPFGAHNSDLVESVKHAGYRGAFTTDPGGNIKGDNPYLLKRMMVLGRDSFGGLEGILAEYM